MTRQPAQIVRLGLGLWIVAALAVGCTKEKTPQGDETARSAKSPLPTSPHESIHEIAATDIGGESLPLSTFEGNVVLVVNVASQCGYTPQYAGLQALWEQREKEGLVVLGVPSNEFGNQEPGGNRKIAMFCKGRYDVDFPMLGKTSVTGDSPHPLYAYLSAETGQRPTWNFNKFLVGRDGRVLEWFDSKVEPDDPGLGAAIDAALER